MPPGWIRRFGVVSGRSATTYGSGPDRTATSRSSIRTGIWPLRMIQAGAADKGGK